MQYYISYVVVHGSATNPFGHAYLIFSKLDTSDPNARPEVFQSIGQYGDPLEPDEWIQRLIFPARLIGPGHLREEHLRFIVTGNKYLHDHKTWPISEQEKDKLLSNLEKDIGRPLKQRDFQEEFSFWKKLERLKVSEKTEDKAELDRMHQAEEEEVKANGGPHFNVLTQSCMTDAKCRIKSVGIHVDDMEGYWVDIPTWTSGRLDRMELVYENGRIVWNSPFVLSARQPTPENEEMRKLINKTNTFAVLHRAIHEICEKFEAKQKALLERECPNVIIDQTVQQLQSLRTEAQKIALYPNKLKTHQNKYLEEQLKLTLKTCHTNLLKTHADNELIRFVQDVIDMFTIFIHHVSSYFSKSNILLGLSPFGFAHRQLSNIQGMDDELKERYIPKARAIAAR